MPSFDDVMLNQSLSDALLIWMYLINAWSSCREQDTTMYRVAFSSEAPDQPRTATAGADLPP